MPKTHNYPWQEYLTPSERRRLASLAETKAGLSKIRLAIIRRAWDRAKYYATKKKVAA
jgi:hypothetical protein